MLNGGGAKYCTLHCACLQFAILSHHKGDVGQGGEALGDDDEGGAGPDLGGGEF